MIYDCIIIGGGASGLFCASAMTGCRINGLVLEKSRHPGTKLLMSGAGQCNITHDGSIKEFISKYGKNGTKIRSCLYKYNNVHLQQFLKSGGVPTITREDGKVFPKSMNGKDVLKLLLRKASENGFRLQCGCDIIQIHPADARPEYQTPLWKVHTEKECYICHHLVIACGGCSYPSTGSDGAMLQVLHRDLNLQIEPPRPALTPVNVKDYPYAALSGISFENAQLSVFQGPDGKLKSRSSGALLLTHENFSGPLILNASRDIAPEDRLILNYLYPETKDTVFAKIMEGRDSKASLLNRLYRDLHLPKNFLAKLIEENGEKPKVIAERLTEDTFTVKSLAGFKKAMATAGGASLSQIDCKTMECKKYPGLYIIGETLDIDGQTGGYNLQFAYSSARAAAAKITEQISL